MTKTKTTRAEKMRTYFTENPEATASQAAKKFKTTYQIAYMVKRSMVKLPKKKAAPWQPPAPLPVPPITVEEPSDPVHQPAHYKVGGIETIDFIDAKQLDYYLANVVKYVSRADHKGNRKQDLEKAKWYLDRAISKL